MGEDMPGLKILANALSAVGNAAGQVGEIPVLGYSETENIRRERLHLAAVARRKKRKRGGPK